VEEMRRDGDDLNADVFVEARDAEAKVVLAEVIEKVATICQRGDRTNQLLDL
jgi:hypothetical protein